MRTFPIALLLLPLALAGCEKQEPAANEVAATPGVPTKGVDRSHKGQLAPDAAFAISQDMGPQGSVEAFLKTLKVDDLGAFHDPKMALSGALDAQVLPTTILYDAQGHEVWRYVGDLDWTGPEAARLLADIPSAAPRG